MRRWVALLLMVVACDRARARPEPTPPPENIEEQAPILQAASTDGVWVVGGILRPLVWVLSADSLTTIDASGARRDYAVRTVAPCQLELTSRMTEARSWVSFGLIDDVLFAGPGTMSVPGDDHTVCSPIGIYRVEPEGCTLETRPQQIGGASEKLAVHCGLELDGQSFYGDDSDHERAAGGPISAYRHRGVLMSTDMAMSPAERAPNEAQAVARLRALDAKRGRGTMPAPFPSAFDGWPLPDANPRFRPKQGVWAAAMNRRDEWRVGFYFFGGLHGERSVGLESVWPSMAPAAFVYRSRPRPIYPAYAPVMIAEREGVTYGRFARTDWDHLAVQVLVGAGSLQPRMRERSASFDVVRVIEPGQWDLGAPVAIEVGGQWRPARVARDHGEQVYIIERERMRLLPKTAVRLVEIDLIHPPGTEVLAVPIATIEPSAFVAARVSEVVGGGLAYVVVTETGLEQTVSFEHVMLRSVGQEPLLPQSPDSWSSVGD